ncbi:MAG: alpha/beta hydrolase [Actinobacteria bacterium]|nr:alpha/beta hydrolase [Actinomycetota bacterium]
MHEELHVAEHGADTGGPLVVLVHGTMDRGTSFRLVVRRLRDLHVVTYDRRGYAKSRGAAPPRPSLDHQADDLLEIIGDRRAVVVGHSLGGDVAVLAALRRPDLIGAVGAYEPPMPWLPWWPAGSAGGDARRKADGGDVEGAAEWFMRRMVGDATWEQLPERTRAERRSEGVALMADLSAVQNDAPFDPADLTVPLVVGRGGSSLPHHSQSAAGLADAVPGAELVEIGGAGHGAHVSHPQEFAALVRRVVERSTEVGRVGP